MRLADPIVAVRLKLKSMNNGAFLAVLVLLLTGYWLLFHHATLGYYWNDSDFHLMRRFSASEIARVFSGPWDVDGTETPGFRPFTLLFNHLRYTLIGESPALHRLFLLALMASLLWMIGWIGLRLGLRRGPVALALLIFASTKSFTGDIVWISVGIRIFANWLLALSVIAMLLFVDYRRLWLALLSLLLACGALLTREESLVCLWLMPLLVAVYQYQVLGKPTKWTEVLSTRFWGFVAALWSLGLIIVLYGIRAVPEKPLSLNLLGLLNDIRWSIWIVGMPLPAGGGGAGGPFLSGSRLLPGISFLWGSAIGALASAFLLMTRRRAMWQVGICLLFLVLAGTPGLIVSHGDLVMLPTLFCSLALAIALFEVWEARSNLLGHTLFGHKAALLIVASVCVVAIGGSLIRAIRQSQDMHPLSINQIWRDRGYAGYVSGGQPETIPLERRNYLIGKLRNLGITSESELEAAYAEAKAKRWTSP